MRAHYVDIEHDFTTPVEQVFGYLAEHENLTLIFPGIKIERVASGSDGTRNGPGSARSMNAPGLPPFVETTTEVVPNERIVYRITDGKVPLRDHEGVMVFSSRPGGSHLHYRIRLSSPIPGLALMLKTKLTRDVTGGLRKLDGLA